MSVLTKDNKENITETGDNKQEVGVDKKIYSPNVDVLETSEFLIIRAEMPGVNESSVEINIEKDQLTLEGKFQFQKNENGQVRLLEYHEGNYFRKFSIGKSVDAEKAIATVKNGILELKLPKIEPKKTKIQIQS
ncbi:Hsp20/alpha crystallin family protein [Leptospira sp. 96542]|nr:Hsp20/alpha crystallin family protein [Leptospira sp. 96542]